MQLVGPTVAGLMHSDTGGHGPVMVSLDGELMGGILRALSLKPAGPPALCRTGIVDSLTSDSPLDGHE